MSSINDIAEAIFEARNYDKKAHAIDHYDRQAFIEAIANTEPVYMADADGVDADKWNARLIDHHGFKAETLGLRLGTTIRKIAYAGDPAATCRTLLDQADPTTGANNIPASRWPALAVVDYLLDSPEPLPEHYTIGDILWHLSNTAEPADLLERAARTPTLAGNYLLTFRELMGWSRFEFGQAADLRTRTSPGGSRHCQVLGNWERGQSNPGRQSARKLRRLADTFAERKGGWDVSS
ncbi:MAG: hypothetical protein ABEN55_08740 [Bradymonadaceae bacterium]